MNSFHIDHRDGRAAPNAARAPGAAAPAGAGGEDRILRQPRAQPPPPGPLVAQPLPCPAT